jgi:hypothetical protein
VFSSVYQISWEEDNPTTVDMASSVKEESRRLNRSWLVCCHSTSSGFSEPELSIIEGLVTEPSTYPKRCWDCRGIPAPHARTGDVLILAHRRLKAH